MNPALAPVGVMNPQERQRAEELIPFLGNYLQLSVPLLDRCFRSPAPKSFIARANQQRYLAQTLDAAPLLASAADYYQTLVNCFVGGPPLPNFSPFAVVRVAYEADARACWLLDPALEEDERMARALTERAENLFEIRRMGLPTPRKAEGNYRKRIKRTVTAGQRWGLKEKTGKDGRVTFIERPRITNLFKSLLPEPSPQNPKMTVGEHTYAALSARAHGTLWALIDKAIPVGGVGKYRRVGMVELDVLELLRLTGIAVALHDRAVTSVVVLAGIEASDWETKRGPMPW